MTGPSTKKRRTLADADEDVRLYQARLAEATKKMIVLARENARMKVLLQKYLEKDESLLCSSQLTMSQSLSQSQSQPIPAPITMESIQESNSEDQGDITDGSALDSFGESQDCFQPSTANDDFVFDSQLSQLDEIANTSHLDEILSFLDRQESLDHDRMFTIQSEVVELRKNTTMPRVGVGVLLYSPQHPSCVLIGIRKGSHGAGKIQLPGGHLEFGETWEECAIREVKEETNLDISNVTHAFTTNDYMSEEEKHYITIFMQATLRSNQTPQLMEPEKCAGWEWQEWSGLKTPEMQARLFMPLHHLTMSEFKPIQ